jgi:DASH complex subunit ASK1
METEIDHNFSRAHHIVTTSILPVVEQYGKHSEAVWEGSKFWKQFFEASANVSLSGYEAPDSSTVHEDETQQSQTYEDDEVEDTVTGATATPPRPTSSQADERDDTSTTFDSPVLAHAHSTPRAPNTVGKEPAFAEYSSPYESLKQEMQSVRTPKLEPTTPGKAQALPDFLGESSPFVPPTSTKKRTVNHDPILHRVLDKTYRVQATPHSTLKIKPKTGFTPGTARRDAPALSDWAEDSSPPSSPAPQLRADIFSSPVKGPRTPGVSVQTPGKGKQTLEATQTRGIFDDDSEDDDDGLDFSPPKTMQFHIPQSRLLQTPGKSSIVFLPQAILMLFVAREASKRIVEDLLMTAGGDITEDTDGLEEDSPSIVRRQVDLDDSF